MKALVVGVGTAIMSYGLFVGIRYKYSDTPMPDDEKTKSGLAMIGGVAVLAVGYFGIK